MSKRVSEIKKTIVPSTQRLGIKDAISLIKSYASSSYEGKNGKTNLVAKFDESVDVSVSLGIDCKKSDQAVRFPFVLPHGNGRSVKILVFTDNPKLAIDNGASYAGSDDIVSSVLSGSMSDFNVCLCDKSLIQKVSKLARVLGPKGMMPSEKVGTVFQGESEMLSLINEIKKGRCSVKNDQSSHIRLSIGRLSFDGEKILDNYNAFLDSLKRNKPSSVKSVFIKNIKISTTMLPLSVDIDLKNLA
jgi:large subunit ribosomal protein L1